MIDPRKTGRTKGIGDRGQGMGQNCGVLIIEFVLVLVIESQRRVLYGLFDCFAGVSGCDGRIRL